jgi:hypothetical protein
MNGIYVNTSFVQKNKNLMKEPQIRCNSFGILSHVSREDLTHEIDDSVKIHTQNTKYNSNYMLENMNVKDEIKPIINTFQTIYQREILIFDQTIAKNRKQIEKIVALEDLILRYFSFIFQVNKIAIYSLKTHLNNGSIKVHTEINKEIFEDDKYHHPNVNKYTLKISGVWENETHYGITFKFMSSY